MINTIELYLLKYYLLNHLNIDVKSNKEINALICYCFGKNLKLLKKKVLDRNHSNICGVLSKMFGYRVYDYLRGFSEMEKDIVISYINKQALNMVKLKQYNNRNFL